MWYKYRYLSSFILSQLLCSLIGFLVIGNKNILLLLYSLLPTVLLILTGRLRKISNSEWMKILLYVSTFLCFGLFWYNPSLTKYILIDEYSLTAVVYLILIIIFAICAPKSSPNYTFGIRMSIALENEEIWKKTHLFYSLVSTAFILPQFLLIFYLEGTARFTISSCFVLLPILISVVYGHIIGQPIIKQKEKIEKEQLEKQIKREQGYR